MLKIRRVMFGLLLPLLFVVTLVGIGSRGEVAESTDPSQVKLWIGGMA